MTLKRPTATLSSTTREYIVKRKLLIAAITASLATLAGCSSESTPDEQLEVAAAQPEPAETQSTTGATETVEIDLTDVSDTKSLTVAKDFSFDTAQTIDIAFDLEDARDTDASVSICTEYTPAGDAYTIDYESCTVRGPMYDGVFSHSMEVTNEFDSVVAVVWFLDPAMPPMYREFSLDTPQSERSVMTMNQRKVIAWK